MVGDGTSGLIILVVWVMIGDGTCGLVKVGEGGSYLMTVRKRLMNAGKMDNDW